MAPRPGKMLKLLCVLVAVVAASVGSSDNKDSQLHPTQCEDVKKHFSAAKIGSAHIVPDTPIHDPEMEVCYKGAKEATATSCCTRKMEHRYHSAAEKDFYVVIRSTSSYLKTLLSDNAAKYTEQFLNMIQLAENNTGHLFVNRYKIPLRERRGPVESLYMDLQAYMKRRQVNIHDSVAQFFDQLFPLVFHNILNDPTATALSEDYRDCLTESRQQLHPQPFGEVPNRLAHQLAKSLLTAKTFVDALSLGIEAINTTDHLSLEPQCTRALTRLRYCSHCQGYIEARPCRNFCYNVMRGCLATVGEIDRHWNEFVDAIKSITGNMQGYYNVESVLGNLPSRISEAILHAMETGHKFYAQVVERCGHPKKAMVDGTTSPLGKLDTSAHKDSTQSSVADSALYSRVETFMRSLMASKGFYHSLADTMCSAEKYATGLDQEHCWNGHELGKYNASLVDMDLDTQMRDNPEMKVAQSQTTNINSLIDKLIHMKKLLRSRQAEEEQMQSDSWGYQKYSGDGYNSRKGTNSAGYYSHQDDEDYAEGSGRQHYEVEGSGGGRKGYYQPVYAGSGGGSYDSYPYSGPKKKKVPTATMS